MTYGWALAVRSDDPSRHRWTLFDGDGAVATADELPDARWRVHADARIDGHEYQTDVMAKLAILSALGVARAEPRHWRIEHADGTEWTYAEFEDARPSRRAHVAPDELGRVVWVDGDEVTVIDDARVVYDEWPPNRWDTGHGAETQEVA